MILKWQVDSESSTTMRHQLGRLGSNCNNDMSTGKQSLYSDNFPFLPLRHSHLPSQLLEPFLLTVQRAAEADVMCTM
jgi:hypothetical protein